jgi:hypothetical protein
MIGKGKNLLNSRATNRKENESCVELHRCTSWNSAKIKFKRGTYCVQYI